MSHVPSCDLTKHLFVFVSKRDLTGRRELDPMSDSTSAEQSYHRWLCPFSNRFSMTTYIFLAKHAIPKVEKTFLNQDITNFARKYAVICSLLEVTISTYVVEMTRSLKSWGRGQLGVLPRPPAATTCEGRVSSKRMWCDFSYSEGMPCLSTMRCIDPNGANPLKMVVSNRNLLFQESIFRGELLVSGYPKDNSTHENVFKAVT